MIPTILSSTAKRTLDDGRVEIEWECPHCHTVNTGCGLIPSGGFDCGDCGVASRVRIKAPVT